MPVPSRPVLLRAGLALAALLAAAGCSSGPSGLSSGACAPTVEGAAVPEYADARAARQAFARADEAGEMEAVLEDVAWLRHEGDEETVLRAHRAYFEQGYTTFVVTLRTKEFTQPTAEQFLLTDSRGATLPGRPLTYAGTMGQEGERFAARFSLSFRHVITREVGWVRLKRLATGSELTWTFPWGTPPAEGPAAAAPANLLRGPATPASPAMPAPAAAPAPAAPSAALPAPAPATTPAPAGATSGGESWSAPPALSPASPAAPVTPVAPAAPGTLPGPAIRRR